MAPPLRRCSGGACDLVAAWDFGWSRGLVHGVDHLGLVHGLLTDAGLHLDWSSQLLCSDPYREFPDCLCQSPDLRLWARAVDDGDRIAASDPAGSAGTRGKRTSDDFPLSAICL